MSKICLGNSSDNFFFFGVDLLNRHMNTPFTSESQLNELKPSISHTQFVRYLSLHFLFLSFDLTKLLG